MNGRTKSKACLIISIFLLGITCTAAAGRNIYVDIDGPAVFNTIQSAIDDANEGDTIIVADGVYTGEGNRDIDFLGKAIVLRSANGPQNCIIDCNGSETEYHRGFFSHSGEDANCVLNGFTIKNGNSEYGGGILCSFPPGTLPPPIPGEPIPDWNVPGPVINNCIISNNSAHYGGGIYCVNSHPIITNCIFRDNTSQYWEDYSTSQPNQNSSAMVKNDSKVHINIPPPLPGWRGYGGGIYCRFSNPTLKNCKFIGNFAYDYGGGMYNYFDSSPILSNCTFISNNAFHGGAIHNYMGSPGLFDCIFNCNSARWGGAIQNDNSSPCLFNCIFSGNLAEGKGGCIYNYHCTPKMTNCTFSGNAAVYGGVVYNFGSDATLTNCILWDNKATWGNEICLRLYYDIWGHKSPSTIDVDYCDVKGVPANVCVDTDCTLNWGDGNIDADPCFIVPGYWDPNGTPEDANDDFWIDGDYHLMPDSPCIDAGDPNYVPEPNEIDLDGKPRVINGRIDMGAYEYSPPIQAYVRIVPSTISLASSGKWIAAFLRLPEDHNVADIDPSSIFLDNEIEPERFWLSEDNQTAIAKFDRGQVQNILGVGQIELTIIGRLIGGQLFEGVDVIKVTDAAGKKSPEMKK